MRNKIATFACINRKWIVFRGIDGTEEITRFNTRRDCVAFVEDFNLRIAKESV